MPDKWDGSPGGKPFADHESQTVNHLGVLAPMCDGAGLLQRVANAREAIGSTRVQRDLETNDHVSTINRKLGAVLVTTSTGSAAVTVKRTWKANPNNGPRAWRALAHWHRPRTAMDSATSICNIMNPQRQKHAQTSTRPSRSGS